MRTNPICIAIAFLAAGAAPLVPETPVEKVHFATCTLPGVEVHCVVARGDDGRIYNVSGALPGLKPGQWLQGSGVAVDRISYCMQGRSIADFEPDKDQRPGRC